MPTPLPPVFDPDHYRRANPDLAGLDDAAAAAHYHMGGGRAAGRVASPMAVRETLVARLDKVASVLEIGPFCNPLVTGDHVEYLDILTADQLRARAARLQIDATRCPQRIHHVGTLAHVPGPYHAVVSSHAIEHQPDLIRHLEDVARLLDHGGRYYLIVPDKRYCFDHFIAESTIAEVLEAWRDERRVHGLARVIEHGALATHNDPDRHWRGDHGTPRPDGRARRIREALDHHEHAQGAYLDVHGWYFTPDTFRDILESLAELGLCAFDATIYDTPHGRSEFCAVLERRRPARRTPSRKHGMDIIVFQTADPFRYAPMLAVTAPTAIEYCRRHGFRYESFVGIKRGPWNWQASYNRILMFKELVDRGHRGWALYLDADAWVHDLDFDLPGYLADKADRAAIFAASGVTGQHWDINDGVTLINLGHPQGRALVQGWWDRFHAISDQQLHDARAWLMDGNDQDLVQRILRDTPEISDAVLVESMDVLNSRHASFIRQHLRAQTPDFEQRTAAIAGEVADVLARGRGPELPSSTFDHRWYGRLAHAPLVELTLVNKPVPRTAPQQIANRIRSAWTENSTRHGLSSPAAGDIDLIDALASGNDVALLQDLAALGRSRIADGILGGARQHDRSADMLFASRLALWTYDKLVSLAEATGALSVENPEIGRWNENARLPASDLFTMVGDTLGIDLNPPAHIGAYLGIQVGPDIVLHMRMIDAIYAAWRLHRISDLIGGGRICEIGGGAGLTAHYARRFGLTDYTLIDLPTMNAVQAYVLGGGGDPVVLAGEPARVPAVRVLPTAAFAGLAPGSIDILFNADSLPQIEAGAATSCLADARRLGVRRFLSINQEARLPAGADRQSLVRDLAASTGWRPVDRHRHWVRAGYVEELFVPT